MSQMLQFMLMNAQAIYLLLTGCKSYPVNLLYFYFYYILTLLALFAQFFVVTYVFKKVKKH